MMNKPDHASSDQAMHAEYNFSGGICGKYAERYAEGSNTVVVAPDVVKQFPTSKAVNDTKSG